eukprot:365642-Chlamydomonas_euryale.AAC.4
MSLAHQRAASSSDQHRARGIFAIGPTSTLQSFAAYPAQPFPCTALPPAQPCGTSNWDVP